MIRALPVSLLLFAAPAAAAPSRVDVLLARGEALTHAADPACASPLEAAALAAEKDDDAYLRALAALGLCREVRGEYGAAHGLVSRALEGAPAETTPAGRAPRWATLRAALRRLDDRVARVLVTWDAGELYLDGRPVVAVSGAVLAVDPGGRLFEARVNGKRVAEQTIEARAGDLPAVALRSALQSLPSPSLAAGLSHGTPFAAPLSQSLPSPFAPALTPPGIAIGTACAAGLVAVVSGVAAGILEGQRVALRSGLAADACPTPDASPRCAELRQVFEQSRGARNAALVAAGLAVAAGGVAVVLHVTGDRVAPSTGMLIVGGSW